MTSPKIDTSSPVALSADLDRIAAKWAAPVPTPSSVSPAPEPAVDHALNGNSLDDQPAPAQLPPDPWDYDFFNDRLILEHVRDFARARLVGPWAVFGALLVEVLAATEPGYHLPPTVGGKASVNLGMILAGRSGAGKGSAEAAAREAVVLATSPAGEFTEIETRRYPLGSGEGLVTTFRPAGTEEGAGNPVTRAIFTAQEIDTLSALSSRTGATVDAVLRGLLMGETLGFTNAGKTTRTHVAPHSYRACVVIGAQPKNAGVFLNGASGGLPQRFVWLPVSDHAAPDVDCSAPLPLWVVLPGEVRGDYTIEVPGVATDAIRYNRRRVLRDDPSVDPLDGHRMLVQLKVAVGFALLDERADVSEGDWLLAGRVMAVSTQTRDDILTQIREAERRANRARAHARADADEIVEDRAEERNMKRARAGVVRKLSKGDLVSRGDINRSLKSDVRPYVDRVLDALEEEGAVIAVGSKWKLSSR